MKHDEPKLQDYWQIIRKRWKLILCILFFGTATAAVVNYCLPDVFEATATLMALEAPAGLASTVSESFRSMIDIPSLTGMGGKSTTEKIINILESRTMCEEVATQLNLQAVFPQDPSVSDPWTGTIRRLKKMRTIQDNHQGLILVSVQYTDPNLTASIANSYVSCLKKLLQENAFSLTKKNRLFIEEQLAHYSEKLRSAEERFKEFQMHEKIISIDEQSKAAIATIAELKAQIINKAVQLGGLKSFATMNNPEVIQMENELVELKNQVHLLEERQENLKPSSLPCLQNAPELGVKYLRLKRDINTFEKVYEMLTQQLILARIQESKEELRFQIVDRAIPPDRKIRPRRMLSILITAVSAIGIGVLFSVLLER
ncbi:MAG: Wzz/FepE/Etk N-terminal domain-containing protein [bacterium]